jgi:hypothetical protein
MISGTQVKHMTRLAGVVALVACSSASWAAGTWNFGGTGGCNANAANQQATNSGTFGNTWRCGATVGTGPSVNVTAWGAQTTSGVTTYQTAFVSNQGSSGWGVASRNEGISVTAPNHSMDNDPGTSGVVDLILLKFDTAVILDKVTLGWWQSDADISVMAYKGPLAPTNFIQGKNGTNTASGLTYGGAANGWALIESAGDPAPDTAQPSTSTDVTYSVNLANPGVSSSYWLISAYNAGFGGAAKDTVIDYVKLFSVASRDPQQVSLPSSLALASIALLGGWQVRRRKVLQRA